MDLGGMLVIVVLILFAATLIRATFGFGDALIAMPSLALLLPMTTATPLVALCSMTTTTLVLGKDWRRIQFRSALTLILSSLIGVPLGLYLLSHGNPRVVEAILAVVIIGFSLFSLSGVHWKLKSNRGAPLFGLLAGVLGGAYNTHGPPLVIFGTLRQWGPQEFRATLQAYFLVIGWCMLFAHWQSGFWTTQVFQLFGWAFPAVLLAIAGGFWLNSLFDVKRFHRMIHLLLLVVGLSLMIRVIYGFAAG